MTQSRTNPFLTRYPGPYAIRPSTEIFLPMCTFGPQTATDWDVAAIYFT